MSQAPLLLIFIIFLHLLSFGSPSKSSPLPFIRAHLTHVDAGRNLTKFELLQRMVERSKARASRLISSHSGPAVQALSSYQGGGVSEYLLKFTTGSPPHEIELELDTGSDLIWTTQCNKSSPLIKTPSSPVPCDDTLCNALPLPACVPSRNSCLYIYKYADRSFSVGVLYRVTVNFKSAHKPYGAVSVPDIAFGCSILDQGFSDEGTSGIVGFGRGALSLPSQLKVSVFSYCFTPWFETDTSPVFLGFPDSLYQQANGPILFTPIFTGLDKHYYLSLSGITVGTTLIHTPELKFQLHKNNTGIIIDSGSSITSLPKRVYRAVKAAFISQIDLPVSNSTFEQLQLDMCFTVPDPPPEDEIPVPALVFHFQGADMNLSRTNYIAEGDSLLCIVLDEFEDKAIIGNFQQQNMHIRYDIGHNKLWFVRANCADL